MEKEWTDIDDHFMKALKKILPHSPEKEIYWSVHFTVGSIIHTVCHYQNLAIVSRGACKWEFDPVLKRLIAHAAAGLEALENSSKNK